MQYITALLTDFHHVSVCFGYIWPPLSRLLPLSGHSLQLDMLPRSIAPHLTA